MDSITPHSDRRYELLAAYSRDIILFIRRSDGRILEANEAAFRAYGYRREELLELSIHDLRAPGTREKISGQMACADRQMILFETLHRTRDGRTFPVEVSSSGASLEGERILISVIRDITDRLRGEQERRTAALLPQQNPSPVLRVRRGGELTFLNPAAEAIVEGWRESSVPERVREAVDAALYSGVPREVEVVSGGREISFLVAPIDGEDYANLYGHDVTERNASQRLLSEATSRQELLADVVSRLLASADPQGLVNELARKVMGKLGCHVFFNYLADPSSGKLRLNAFAGVPDETVHAIEWLDYGVAVCGCAAAAGSRIVAEDIANSDDPRTTLVRSFGVTAYACHPLMAGGEVLGTLSFGSREKTRFSPEDLSLMRVVTDHIALAMERMRTQTLLRQSEARYRAVARNIPDGAVWVADLEGRLLVAEGSLVRRLGFERERVEGRAIREVFDPPLAAIVEGRFRRVLDGAVASYETEINGRTVWSQYVPLRDEGGVVMGAMALALDITERRRMEARLQQSQKMESIAVLAGGIAHDFNNLLVGIIGNASLAEDMLPPGSPAAARIRDALKAGERAAHLTREMLAYSGRGRFVIEPVDVSEMVREVTTLMRSSVPNHVTLRLDLDQSTPRIEADSAQIQQVIMNLVINAAEAIGDQRGLITVRTRTLELDAAGCENNWGGAELSPGVYVQLDVSDTGCGMDEATKARIFDPFFTTKFTGRGLGLAAVSGIVRGHKGALRVESAPGMGSVFSFAIPAGAGDLQIRKKQVARQALAGAGRVLIVDDEPVVRTLAATALNRLGYHAEVADSGPAALAELKRSAAYDLVILDLSMPGMSGQETLARMRESQPHIRVIVSSGFSESECMRLFENQRISGFLQKPYTATSLGESVKAALSS